MRSKLETLSVDQDKSGSLLAAVREMQIDRLRNVFNKLSSTKESQQTAVCSLLNRLVMASKHSPVLLRYTCFKISSNLVADCQEDHFTETDESHPTKLARVACGLCSHVQDFSAVLRAQLNHHCPLTVPRRAEEGMQGEAFLENMRFRRKKLTVG